MKKLLFNPFATQPDNKLLVAGLLSVVTGSILGWLFNARFDGVLDLHFVPETLWWHPFADNAINVFSAVTLLFIAGKIINRKTRITDVLSVVLLARTPLYLYTFANINSYTYNATEVLLQAKDNIYALSPTLLIIQLVSALVVLALVFWYMALLYNGFRVATNLKKGSQIAGYIATVLIAEILSKILISVLPY